MADDYAALLACSIIVINGVLIAKSSLHEILDGNVSEEVDREMRALASEVAGVREIKVPCAQRRHGNFCRTSCLGGCGHHRS